MKKQDFDNRLQRDLFPEMPPSFERKLKQTLENEGVKTKKRPTATGIFAGVVSVAAAAAVLLIVLLGVLGGGNSHPIQAAAPGETIPATAAPWKTKVFTLSAGFQFADEEKAQAMHTAILDHIRQTGESEPDELWLCAVRSRYVAEDTGDRADGYLSGYYVLAQHAFGENDGPELYCLSEEFEVLWCTEGSAPGPNHAVNPEAGSDWTTATVTMEDGQTFRLVNDSGAAYQSHFLYGTEPFIPEPGVPHVKRGLLVGAEPGTDIEFSMAASIADVTERLAGSAHMDMAREYFLVTVSAHDWDSVMENPILRFETLEGPVDVNMETDLPLANTVPGL